MAPGPDRPRKKYTVDEAIALTIKNLRRTNPNKDVSAMLDAYEQTMTNQGRTATPPKTPLRKRSA